MLLPAKPAASACRRPLAFPVFPATGGRSAIFHQLAQLQRLLRSGSGWHQLVADPRWKAPTARASCWRWMMQTPWHAGAHCPPEFLTRQGWAGDLKVRQAVFTSLGVAGARKCSLPERSAASDRSGDRPRAGQLEWLIGGHRDWCPPPPLCRLARRSWPWSRGAYTRQALPGEARPHWPGPCPGSSAGLCPAFDCLDEYRARWALCPATG